MKRINHFRPQGRRERGGIRGFTLIELLVVIAIIALLSSVVLVTLSTARMKAKSARIVAELDQIKLALEMYYDDNGQYPIASTAWQGECTGFGSKAPIDVVPGLAPKYMATFPTMPGTNASASTCYLYVSSGIGDHYKLLAHQIQAGIPGFNYLARPELIDPQRDGGSLPTVVDPPSNSAIWAWRITDSDTSGIM